MIPSPRTVFVSGNFNVLHPGHLRLLRFAKEYSDRLAANAAHVPEQYRLEMVKANSWVDEALLIDQPVTEVLERLRPEIV